MCVYVYVPSISVKLPSTNVVQLSGTTGSCVVVILSPLWRVIRDGRFSRLSRFDRPSIVFIWQLYVVPHWQVLLRFYHHQVACKLVSRISLVVDRSIEIVYFRRRFFCVQNYDLCVAACLCHQAGCRLFVYPYVPKSDFIFSSGRCHCLVCFIMICVVRKRRYTHVGCFLSLGKCASCLFKGCKLWWYCLCSAAWSHSSFSDNKHFPPLI